jgi:hypothetical protein
VVVGVEPLVFPWDLADISGISAVEFGAGRPGKRRRDVRLLFG